jgi:serine/threonine-protein kinase
MEDLTGKQLGQYQIVEPLGNGGMASVYKAYQSNMERYVALKILPRHLAADPEFVSRFKNESKVIASLEHPNILPVYDFGEANGYTYLVMRFIENGKTLNHLLHGQPISCTQIQHVMNQVAAALDYAHSRDVIHRDVKPSNVLLDEYSNCLLSDFGLAKVLINSSQLTASGVFLGTPKYASPEQCLGSSKIDQRSDVYSLGVILYEMATGQPPFDAETPMGVVIKHIHDPLPMPRVINPDLSAAVERVILKALSKKANGRYSTAGELAQAFNFAVEDCDDKTSGVPSTRKLPAQEPPTIAVPQESETGSSRDYKKWIGVVLIGMVLLVLGAASAIWGMNRFVLTAETETLSARIPSSTVLIQSHTRTPTLSPTSLPTFTLTVSPTQTVSLTQHASETTTSQATFEGFSVITQESLIFRTGPSTIYRWVAGSPYPDGTAFVIKGLSEDGEWYFGILPDELEAWIQVNAFDSEIDMNQLPIIEAPPTPIPAATNTTRPKDKDNGGGRATQEPTVDPYP